MREKLGILDENSNLIKNKKLLKNATNTDQTSLKVSEINSLLNSVELTH